MRAASGRWWQRLVGVTVAVLATAIAARWSFELPLTPVPQTAQTLAVLVSGILLGSRWGAIAMVLYVVVGAIGLPVFAGGRSGLEHLLGPTGGFLVGFVLGAAIAGWWIESKQARTFPRAVTGMLLAHASILLVGWGWLSTSLGPSDAWLKGVAPFLGGGALKSLLAAFVAYGMVRRLAAQAAGPSATGV